MIPELIFGHEQNENNSGELLPGWGDLLFKCHLKFFSNYRAPRILKVPEDTQPGSLIESFLIRENTEVYR